MKNILHENRDKNGDLVRVRQSVSGEVYIDSYKGDERKSNEHERLEIKMF